MAVNPMMDSTRGLAGIRQAGRDGMNAGLDGMAEAAHEIASLNLGDGTGATPAGAPGKPPADAAEALVDLKVYQRQVQASAAVVASADAVIGFLLDIRV